MDFLGQLYREDTILVVVPSNQVIHSLMNRDTQYNLSVLLPKNSTDKLLILEWKCNQALIVGFGDNDHAIRELMRFIEMTSMGFIFEGATRNRGAPNYKYR